MTVELPRVAIAIGDPAGIGPEIALKAALDPAVRRIARPVLVGDRRAIDAHAQACGLAPTLDCFADLAAVRWRADAVALVTLEHFNAEAFEIAHHKAANGHAACDAARTAIEGAIAGQVDAVVAAPQTERSIKLAGIDFDGYPSFVARCTGTPVEQASLMICFEHAGAEMRIAHVTLQTSLRHAIDLITIDHVERVVQAVDTTLKKI
ncbi:MAG: 4-hydroxythreonine-4-phosphate dehydrogenase PdxA, partial [Burkholderiales bacterium]